MSGTIFHPFVLDNAAGQETVVGIGSDSVKYGVGISSDTHVTGIQTVTGFLHADGGIKDSSGNIGSSGKVLSSTGSGLAWIDPSEGSTTNAINVGTNLDSTNADQFVAFMGASGGNNPVRVDADLKYNPSTNILSVKGITLPGDDQKITIGADNPLEIKHDSTSGQVELKSNANISIMSGDMVQIENDSGGNIADFIKASGCKLYHNVSGTSTLRLETTNDGVTISGDLTVTDIIANGNIDLGSDSNDTITMSGLVDSDIVPSGTTRDIGSNANRWRNLYATIIRDKDNQTGTSGQVLSSTGTELDWINIGDVAAGSAAQVAVSDESGDQTCFPLFVTDTTGNQSPKSGSNLTFNSSTGQLNATKFVGDGSGLTGISDTNTQLSTEAVQDIVGGMVTGNTESGITVTYDDAGTGTGKLNFSVGTLNQNTSGNAATATKLATARTISGASFDGTTNITLNNANITNGAGYVTSAGAVPSGMIMLWYGSVASIPSGWVLCNGSNSTPDLRDRFVVGAGSGYAVDATGGSANATLVSHSHTINNHTHSFSGSGSNTHSHGIPKGSGGSQASIANYVPSPRVESVQASFSSDNATISISVSGTTGNPSDTGTDTQGSSGTNANLPPYYALCYIMKT